MRIGSGYDVHRLVYGRKLIVGGVEISYEKGLLGHSDADVLVHALCDAMVGAMGRGDIGRLFPDSDPANKDVYSIKFLEKIVSLVHKDGLCVINVDATLFAEAPRMAPYRSEMTANLAAALGLRGDCVNVKATTTEGLGYIGRGCGMAAMCVVLLDDGH